MKNWQQRWFVLRGDQLFYYKDKDETKPQVRSIWPVSVGITTGLQGKVNYAQEIGGCRGILLSLHYSGTQASDSAQSDTSLGFLK